jgi:Domain of unknown function (DUF4252)
VTRHFGIRAIGIALLPPCLLAAGCGISGNLRQNPGYASFGTPNSSDVDREFAFSFGPVPLKLARMVNKDDPELTALLKGVRAVRIYGYEIGRNPERLREQMESVREHLIHRGWEPLAAIRDDGELVTALAKIEDPNTISGLALIVQDRTELTLINVIGNLNPEHFGELIAGLDIELPAVALSLPAGDAAISGG